MIPASLSAPVHSSDEIVVVPHDAAWPARFRIESQLLHVALSELQPSIEHIGSTAVPGLAAKPIIDMLVGVESLAAFETQARRLAVFGYQYIPEYERALPDRRFFKRVVNGVRTHHVHVVEKNGVYWKRYMKFRNSLRDDAWLAVTLCGGQAPACRALHSSTATLTPTGRRDLSRPCWRCRHAAAKASRWGGHRLPLLLRSVQGCVTWSPP